jgi:diacylglycerol kinase (ATP)
MKIRFIVNPISGTGKQRGIEAVIEEYTDFEYDTVFTNKSGDATRLSQIAVDEKIDVVIAVGGDGTVNECAKAIIGSKTALGVIPCGSGNGFAFHFGMKKDIRKAILQLNSCAISVIDSCTANNIPFVNVSGIGFDAHIAHLFSDLKERGFLNYLKLIKNEIFTYKVKDYQLNYNGKSKEVKANLIAFANASQYGNDFCISPKANASDGLIDFVIVKEMPKWKILFILYQVLKGKVHLSKYVEIIQTNEMLINSKNNIIHLDGEPLECKNLITIKVKPKTLKIFMPYGER